MEDERFGNYIVSFEKLRIIDKIALLKQLTDILNTNLNEVITNRKDKQVEHFSKEVSKLSVEQLMLQALANFSTQEQQRYEYLTNCLRHDNISNAQRFELAILANKLELLKIKQNIALVQLSLLNNISIEEARRHLELRRKEEEHALLDELCGIWKDEDSLTAETIIDRTYSNRKINFDY